MQSNQHTFLKSECLRFDSWIKFASSACRIWEDISNQAEDDSSDGISCASACGCLCYFGSLPMLGRINNLLTKRLFSSKNPKDHYGSFIEMHVHWESENGHQCSLKFELAYTRSVSSRCAKPSGSCCCESSGRS